MITWNKAEACFKENIQYFVNREADPAAFNLNNGLRMMSESSQALHQEVQILRKEVAELRSAIRRL